MRLDCRFVFIVTALSAAPASGWMASTVAAEPEQDHFTGLPEEFLRQTRPLLERFCLDCHSAAERAGEIDLERFSTLAEVRRGTGVWLKIVEMLGTAEMPPKEATQPRTAERKQLLRWAERYLRAEARANAGDPGPVVLRRLNNAEYTHTIRDLTGVDLSPAREFPTDSAAGEGFTNTGNALAMSPALLRKYLGAGKEIARHAVLLPDGFRFSPHATRRDWSDEVLAAIREFYRRFVDAADLGVGSAVGNVNVHGDTRIGRAGLLPLESYLAATLDEREALRAGGKTIEAVARERGLHSRYLRTLWSTLSGSNPSLLLDRLRSLWRSAVPEDAGALAADVATWQKGLWVFGPVGLIGRQGGPSRWMEPVNPLVTQKDLRFKIPALEKGDEKKAVVLSLVATDAGDGNKQDFVIWQKPRLVAKDLPDILLRDLRQIARGDPESNDTAEWGLDPAMFGRHPNGGVIDTASLCVRAPSVIKLRLPAQLAAGRDLVTTAVLDDKTAGEGSVQVDVANGTPAPQFGLFPSEVIVNFSQVTQVFSDRRDLSHSRPILVAKDSSTRQRLELALDQYRSVFPAALCYTQIVPVDEVLTLQLFYREDDHLARLMLDDAQKARLDRLWAELYYVSQSAVMRVSALELLLEAMTGNYQYKAVETLRSPFNESADRFRKVLIESESKHVDALIEFAARAYRRPLSAVEGDELRGLYRRLRRQEMVHDEAFRLTLARVLVASPFLYRLEKAEAGTVATAVSEWELASRLSYFLWSSPPDEGLRAAAADGTLHTPEVLVQQMRRMLTDTRVRRLATEFVCQWLHIHDFDALDEKSEKYFPEFADLRGDMYEESILFFTDLFQRDASILSLLGADHTFVNERLAAFYGIDGVKGAAWRRVEGMRGHGRGGILGLSTTLAKQSGASRTSPILRGNWVSEVLLGEKLPRPPKGVPELPVDETVTGGLTVRQLVAKHTSDPKCSSCHQRIDPFGFALEGFDGIGRRRESDRAGRPVDTRTKLPDGNELSGLEGLRGYLLGTRRDAFLRQFCRKLLGYAIGREVQLSDEPLLTKMQRHLARNDYRFSGAVETIILSRQFRMIRPAGRRTARF